MLTNLLLCLSLVMVIITARHATSFFKNSYGPRKRRHIEVIPAVMTSTTTNPVDTRILSKPIQTCLLDDPSTCTGYYNCISHKYELHIYDDKLTRIDTFPPNIGKEGYCVPIKKRKCNPYTGNSVIVKTGDSHYDSICICKYPHLVTKRSIFEDCHVKVACGDGQLTPLGEINYDPMTQGICLCPEGFSSHRDPVSGPLCKKSSEDVFCSGGKITKYNECRCPVGYLRVFPEHPSEVDESFRKSLRHIRCIKNPCYWSAGWPKNYLPYSRLNRSTYQCECDRINGSFPVHSTESVLSTHWNACQTFDEHAEYESMKYGCTYYGKSDGEKGRTCWFFYRLLHPKSILGKTGQLVKVIDQTDWIDKLIPDAYFAKKIYDWLKQKAEETKKQLWAVPFYYDSTNYNQQYETDLYTCQTKNKQKWGGVTQICKWNNKIYVSPIYAQNTGYNGFLLENASDIFLNNLKPRDKQQYILPELSLQRFQDAPSPTVIPQGLL